MAKVIYVAIPALCLAVYAGLFLCFSRFAHTDLNGVQFAIRAVDSRSKLVVFNPASLVERAWNVVNSRKYRYIIYYRNGPLPL